MVKALISSLLILSVVACGPSREELAAIQLRLQKIDETKGLIDDATTLLDVIGNRESTLMADLAFNKDQLKGMKEFQSGRTSQERENQIGNQTLEILAIEELLEETQKETLRFRRSSGN